MQYGTAFTYPFKDPDWIKKFVIAAVFLLIPIVGPFFLLGWGLDITRRVINGDPTPLAEWTDFGKLFMDGLKGFVIGFVYALPVILVQACNQGLIYGLPQLIDADTANTLSLVVLSCFGCLSFLYGIFLAVAVPAALGNFVAHDSLGAAFRFGEIIRLLKAAPAAYVVVVLTTIITPFIGMMGIVFCIVGLFFTMPYVAMINQFMYGEAYRVARLEQQGVETSINQGL
ncbi:MAG TPA: hypothetical protein DEH25_09150 [Chloroflexi bacterium]|nr:hypothetical protein [Chloroflexota bacterium]